jgi:hypothetical protein
VIAGGCALFEAGALRAVGLDVPGATSASAPWYGIGALARIEWAPVGRVRVEAEAGAIAPLERVTLVLSPPRVPLYSVPAVGATASLGVGLDFP